MSILTRLFKGTIRKTLEQMASDADVIQWAIASKLAESFIKKYGKERGFKITAAVTNKLFSKVSPIHSKEDLDLAEGLAVDLLKTDHEVRYAALMACRARLLHAVEYKTQDQWVLYDKILWMATIWTLPPDEAHPDTIRLLASTLHKKY